MQSFDNLELLLSQMVEQQKGKLLKLGREIIPCLTSDDVLQPNDFPELEHNPLFRYEEGVLEGLQSALMACKREEKELC